MATKVFETEVLELQDGSEVTVRPLNLKRLRKFMEVVDKIGDVENELEAFDPMVDAVAIAVQKDRPDLAEDREKLEDVIDLPTVYKILEIAGGIQFGDPNLMRAAMGGQTSTSRP
jgi:hypothetical protein